MLTRRLPLLTVHDLQDHGRQEAHRNRAQGREGRLLRGLLQQAAGRRLPLRRPRRGDRHKVWRQSQQAHLCRLVRTAPVDQGDRRGAGWGLVGARVMPWLRPRVSPPFAHGSAAHWRCRSDDNASVRPKMLYASSKDAIKKALTGINDEYQATESASWLICRAGSPRAHGRRP